MKNLPHRLLILVGTLLSAAACDDGIVGSSTVTGSYLLLTINGVAPPGTIATTGSTRVALVSDVITLYQGGTYQETAVQRTYVANVARGDSTIVTTGTYGLVGTSITLILSDRSAQRIGMINANVMTFLESGLETRYRK